MKRLIIPLTKSPHPQGRIGIRRRQDWYRALVKAVKLSVKLDAGILLLTNNKVANAEPETHYYSEALEEFECERCTYWEELAGKRYIVVRECQETISQVERSIEIAKEHCLGPVFVSTFMHYLRVRWLARAWKADHYSAFGIPRPREALSDLILIFLFPIVDGLGWRRHFQERIQARREQGKL